MPMIRLRPLLASSAIILLAGCNSILDFGSYSITSQNEEVDGGDGGDARECETNAECIQQLGDFSICRKTDFKCAKLVNEDCPSVIGDWRSESAVILGSIQPLFGADQSTGIPQLNSIGVGVDDFRSGASGLPPAAGTTARRPIVVVACSEASADDSDGEIPARSARHLIDTVGVPAIIGASFSGNTLKVAEQTIPAKVLLMSPSATSVVFTTLSDDGLVWRTSPSDVLQAEALTRLMPQIETSTRARLSIDTATPVKVLVLHKGDAYGKGLGEALSTGLSFNGKSASQNLADGNLSVIDYGDPGESSSIDLTATVQQITNTFPAGAPQIVFLVGTAESITGLLVPLEAATNWPNAGANKPTWLLADAGLTPDVPTAVAGNTSLRTRIFGTVPGSNNATYQLFRSRYLSFVKDGTTPDSFGTSGAYDALYLLAYAIAATSDKPLTGPNIAEGLKRLVPPGQPTRPGSTQINAALAVLASGGNIDYDGASGPLNFDVNTGEASSDIQFWCLPTTDGTTTGTAANGTNSGMFFNAATNQIEGGVFHPPSAGLQTACNVAAIP